MHPEIQFKIVLRTMSRGDIAAGLRLCRASNWNQVEEDWRCFLEIEGGGGALAEKDGAAVGTVAFLRYGAAFGWIAMMLVDPAERRSGIGSRLMAAALESLSDEVCVRLDATPAGEPLYRRFGFVPEYALVRAKAVAVRDRLGGWPDSVRAMQAGDLSDVFALDERVFGARRAALLTRFYRRAPQFCAVAAEQGRLLGYCFGRQGYLYNHIGPVVAESLAVARGLVCRSLAADDGAAFAIDVPRLAPEFIEWTESVGFQVERPFLRMRRGGPADHGMPQWQFAIAGPEFG